MTVALDNAKYLIRTVLFIYWIMSKNKTCLLDCHLNPHRFPQEAQFRINFCLCFCNPTILNIAFWIALYTFCTQIFWIVFIDKVPTLFTDEYGTIFLHIHFVSRYIISFFFTQKKSFLFLLLILFSIKLSTKFFLSWPIGFLL